MRSKIYQILQKYLHKIGVYTQYYASDKAIHYHLKSKPTLIQNYELNKLCKTLKSAKNHTFYNSLLKMFVPTWDAKITDALFISGGGVGESSLDCFRKVTIDGTHFFEKIYYQGHDDLVRIKWFSVHAYSLMINQGIVAPQVKKMYEGDAFVIVYFEYLNLEPLHHSEIEENFIYMAKKLYSASLKKDITTLDTTIPECITGFKHHFEYKNKIAQANKVFSRHTISNSKIEEKIKSSTVTLAHGDIQEKNAFKNYMLIDFDTFGLYPIGYEVAFVCFRLLITKRLKKLPTNWLETNFIQDISLEHWEDFERNFNYFLCVFLATFFKKEPYKYLESQLVEKLKQYDT